MSGIPKQLYWFTCPSCEGDGGTAREADVLDYVEGLDNGYGMVERTCSHCGGRGEVEGTLDDIDEWGEPLRPIDKPEVTPDE